MAKRPEVKEPDTESLKSPAVSEQPNADNERPIIGTKTVLVLNTGFRVTENKTVKSGTRLTKGTGDFYVVNRKYPEHLKKIDETTYEAMKDLIITVKKSLPCGTVLDPVKDKWIIDRIKSKHTPEQGALKEMPVL